MLKLIPFYASLLKQQLADNRKATKVHVLLYGAIESHSIGPKGCIAGNDLLSEETGITKSEIRRYLKEMKDAGWITYEVGKDSKRGEIIPMFKLGLPLWENPTPPVGKTTRGVRNNPTPTIDIISEVAVEDTCTEQSSDAGEKEVKEKISMEQVREVIDAFQVVNESYREFYGKKTQYGAAKTLIKTYPKEQIMWMIKTAPGYNKMPYRSGGDKVYTPYDLLKKWSIMKDNLVSYKLKKTVENKEIIR